MLGFDLVPRNLHCLFSSPISLPVPDATLCCHLLAAVGTVTLSQVTLVSQESIGILRDAFIISTMWHGMKPPDSGSDMGDDMEGQGQ